MPAPCAASRTATAVIVQIQYQHPDSCIELHPPTAIATAKTRQSWAATSSTNACEPVASDHTPHPRRSNSHSARRTTARHLPQFLPLEVFVRRPPDCVARPVSGRHPKTFTIAEVTVIRSLSCAMRPSLARLGRSAGSRVRGPRAGTAGALWLVVVGWILLSSVKRE